jgi:alpha-L-fucosidase
MKFDANFESLKQYKTPDWFFNAKFGIWSHWSVGSVPMFGDWYARHMYIQGHPQYNHHLRHYGHPTKHGWKDIAKLWKAEKFEPEKLMDLYKNAGAKYFMSLGCHHDGFCNFDSSIRNFNSCRIGPKKDIVKMWQNAAQNSGLKFGISDHLATSFTWWQTNKLCDTTGKYKNISYDGANKKYKDIYHTNPTKLFTNNADVEKYPWFIRGSKVQQKYWYRVIKEMVDKYNLDLIYMDGAIPFADNHPKNKNPLDPEYEYGLKLIAHYYNESYKKHGNQNVVYFQKRIDGYSEKITTIDIERGLKKNISSTPWQSDTCFGDWFYNDNKQYKSVNHIITQLIDIVSKGGCMLLNILQLPDGSLDDEIMYRVLELKKWFSINGSAIHNTTTANKIGLNYGIGNTKLGNNKAFGENEANWNNDDYRFTYSNNKLNIFVMSGTCGLKTIDLSIKNSLPIKVKQAGILQGKKIIKLPIIKQKPFSIKVPNEFESEYPYVITLNL